MKNSVLSHIRILIPKFNLIPFEEVKKWADRYYQRLSHVNAQRKKAIRTHKDFKEKIGQPTIDATNQFISPDFRSRSGLNHDAIIGKLKDKMLDNATSRKYQEKLERAYRTIDGVPARKIKDKLDFGSNEYALKMTFGAWRFIGPIDGQGKGAVILAGEWLSGNSSTSQSLRDKDRIITGSPILITDSKRAGQLRRQLRNQLLRSGQNISEGHYSAQVIKQENDVANQLVREFTKDGIEPFSNEGASHIDFVIEPQSVMPADARQVKDIQYKIHSFFLGEKIAQELRTKWIETNYYAPINPDDYIGNRKKPAYFDMSLDIRIEIKKE
jgi:hypothetical protein